MMKRAGIKHVVLNGKYHEKEAEIVAQAGRKSQVTIATNMAGRGTDILLGGNAEFMARDVLRKREIDPLSATPQQWNEAIAQVKPQIDKEHEEVVQVGGLHIIGTERHEARRIDNQLRGRSGRQGDRGSSRFFMSFGDEVMRRFAPDLIGGMLGRLGMDENTPLESSLVSKASEQAQTKVEGHNYDIRKHVVQYDDVMNQHRDKIYEQRRRILEGTVDLRKNVLEMVDQEIERAFDTFAPGERSDDWDMPSLIAELRTIVPLPAAFTEQHVLEADPGELIDEVIEHAPKSYEEKERNLGEDQMRTLERLVLLGTIDRLWVYHLTALDEMRQGIGLTGYGGRDALVEYKREAHDMYIQLTEHIQQQVSRRIFHVTLTPVHQQATPP